VKRPEGVRQGPIVRGKTFLRQEEFGKQRGLRRQARELELDGVSPGAAATSIYLEGARAKESLLAEAPPVRVEWRPLGPAGIPRGQTYGSGPGGTTTVAGRVPAIAVDPSDSQHVLLGAAAGGVWQTRDGGQSWMPVTDDQPTLSIGALAFDPSDPSKVYAGTGEGNSEYAQLGQGMLASSDGGSTWRVLAQQAFTGFGFYRIVVDPHNSGRLIVATTGGAALSPDGGQSWSLLHRGMTWDASLAYLGAESELLLAAPDGLFAQSGSVAPARVDLPGLPATLDRNRERMAVCHVPSDPGQAFVFAASGGKPLLWHRAASGQPFQPVEKLPAFGVPPYLDDVLSVDQAAYDWYVAVPPGSADVVYLGAIELVRGERSGNEWRWSDISSRREHGDSIHPDQHTMAFDPQQPRVLYAGSDGGCFRSSDGGDSWQSLNVGLAISEVEYLAERPDEPTWILAGLQDNGTIRREQEGQWSQVGLGDGGDCGINTAQPDTCFHSYYYMYMERSTSRGDPQSWQNVTPPGTDNIRKLFYPPLEVNEEIVAKAGEIVYISSDGAGNWKSVPLPQVPDGPSVASALGIPTKDRLLAGTIWGDVFRIDRSGAGWGNPTKLTRPVKGWISDLLVDPDLPHRYWVTFSSPGAVYRSDDDGGSWTEMTANLPQIPVNAIVTDPADRDRVWVACDVGVFESRDARGSWSVFGTGLPNALAEDLLFYEPDRLLRVGTRSRGVWEAAVG
jgi:photosystem II stability/assembly factor-like uncharacterized protein